LTLRTAQRIPRSADIFPDPGDAVECAMSNVEKSGSKPPSLDRAESVCDKPRVRWREGLRIARHFWQGYFKPTPPSAGVFWPATDNYEKWAKWPVLGI
jgi:hypothetical protein